MQRIKKNFYYRSVLPSITDSNKDNKSLPVDEEKIPIYNIVSFAQNPLTWRYCCSKLDELKSTIHSSKSVWYPFVICHENKYLIELLSIFCHWIPGFIMDSIIYLMGKKPMFLNIYRKIEQYKNVVSFFSTHQWEFTTDNVVALWNKLSVVDKHKFFFNIADLNWDSYFITYSKGVLTFIIKDDEKDIKRGKILHERLRIIHYTLVTVLSGLLLWGLYLLLEFLYTFLFSF